MASDETSLQTESNNQVGLGPESVGPAGRITGETSKPNNLEFISTEKLKPNNRNARTHSKKQIQQIADSIQRFGFTSPILVDESYGVIAGHGRLQAAQKLVMSEVPIVRLSHLNTAEKRAYILADNKIALNAGWDSDLLAAELEELSVLLPEHDLDIGIIGFDTGELDFIFADQEEPSAAIRKEDEVPVAPDNPITRRGDIWQMGGHRLLCGDARDGGAAKLLFAGQVASIVITDPPYNVKVQGHVGGRGKTKHSEFAFASGEMSDQEFKGFLHSSLQIMLHHAADGALLDVFMDWRHIETLLSAGRELDLVLKNICVWNKSMPGQGSFYRSAHELIAIFAKPGAASTNNVQLGKYGRNRTNVWTYPSVNTFQVGKEDDLALHPTVKPVAMIADAVKDASKRGEIVFDPFLGSGTTLLAAEKTGRRCFGVEYEPKYADTAILRWQQMTGKDAVLMRRLDDNGEIDADVDCCFDELRAHAAVPEGAKQ